MRKSNLFWARAAVIAALYVVFVILWPLSSSVIQVRLAESLTILPYFTASAIPGISIGCLAANLFIGAPFPDIVFGSFATLLGAIGSYLLRRHKYLVSLPPILANTLIIPWVLRLAYGAEDAILFLMLTVGIGEVLSCGLLGILLLTLLEKHRNLFRL